MSTMGQLVDRTLRVLYPADDSPTQTTLNGAITNVATSVVYLGTDLTVDEEELFTVGVRVECEQELMVITAANHSTNTLTVRRGVDGTTAAAHSSGAVLTLAPVFPRRDVFDALADNIQALYPSLYRETTDTITLTTGHTDVDADAMTVVGLRYLRGTRYYDADVSLLSNFTPSATTKAIRTTAPTGATAYLTYRGKFARPAAEADNVQSVSGVEEGWERIVMVGAAAQLLSAREFDAVNVEFVTEAMRGEGFPTGSASRIREALLRYHQFLLEQARRQQLASAPEVVSVNAVASVGGY